MDKFNEVIRENSEDLDELFSNFGDSRDLAKFLVFEGYLDDTYYQYTSLFHSGRLSPNDNAYLIRIRAFSNPDPDFQVDNAKEVIAAMRDEDFSRSYVLNVKIVDSLLADPATYAARAMQLFNFIASDFDGSEAFLAAYYERGTAVERLLAGLASNWPGFVAAAIASPANLAHVGSLISRLDDRNIAGLADRHPALASFVSERLPDILAQGAAFPPERLQLLDIQATDLSAVASYPGFIRSLFETGLYVLSIQNLDVIFRQVLGIEDGAKLRERNYTMVLEADSPPLLEKINGQFGQYLENVILRLPDNRHESIAAIKEIVRREEVDADMVVCFLERQSASLPNLEQIRDRLHPVVFKIGRIDPTWENCQAFIESKSYDAEILTEFLNRPATLAVLQHHMMPSEAPAAPLRQFIIGNDALSDDAYAAYIKALPKRFKTFPSPLSREKTRRLVKQNSIEFSAANLAQLADDLPMGIEFVVKNIENFFDPENEYDLDDDFREQLLRAEVSDEDRLQILSAMELNSLAGMPARAVIVGSIIARTGLKIDNLGVDGAREVIIHSRSLGTQIVLLNILHEMFDDQQVREILHLLPRPLRDIGPGWATPRLESNDVNVEFVTWLKKRGFISSWAKGGIFDDDIRMHMFRK